MLQKIEKHAVSTVVLPWCCADGILGQVSNKDINIISFNFAVDHVMSQTVCYKKKSIPVLILTCKPHKKLLIRKHLCSNTHLLHSMSVAASSTTSHMQHLYKHPVQRSSTTWVPLRLWSQYMTKCFHPSNHTVNITSQLKLWDKNNVLRV